MPIDCANPPCTTVLPASSIISIFGDVETQVNTKCCTNILYLVDNAGLVDQTDSTSGGWLTTESRTQQISSLIELQSHYSPCSTVYKAVSKYLSWPIGNLVRPASITLGFFDSANGESMTDAVGLIKDCNSCFYVMAHVPKTIADVALYDTADQVSLGAWGTANQVVTVLSTVEPEALSPTDNTSNAYLSKTAGDSYATYQWLNEECVDELDADCLPTGNIVNDYGYQDLLLAAVVGSADCEADSYQFNVKFKPSGGSCLLGTSTAALTQQQTIYATGSNPFANGIQTLWPHHVNVYHNVAGYCMFMEGLTATGNYIDEMIHRRYVEDSLNELLMAFLVENNSVSMADLSGIRGQVTFAINDFVSKGIITNVLGAIDTADFNNVIASGNGWVLSQSSVTTANLQSRVTPTFTFCYVRPSSTNYISIGLCQSNIAGGV